MLVVSLSRGAGAQTGRCRWRHVPAAPASGHSLAKNDPFSVGGSLKVPFPVVHLFVWCKSRVRPVFGSSERAGEEHDSVALSIVGNAIGDAVQLAASHGAMKVVEKSLCCQVDFLVRVKRGGAVFYDRMGGVGSPPDVRGIWLRLCVLCAVLAPCAPQSWVLTIKFNRGSSRGIASGAESWTISSLALQV